MRASSANQQQRSEDKDLAARTSRQVKIQVSKTTEFKKGYSEIMFLHVAKTLPYPAALLLTTALVLQMKAGLALPAGRRTRTTETPLQPWCSASYSLNRETVASRIEKDNHQIQQLTKILLDGHGGAQRMKIPNLEGWNNCPTVAVTPGPVTNLSTELQQIFNHSIKLQHLNYMYRVLVAMVKSDTTAANSAKLDMLNMLLVSLQGQLELYLLAEQCTNGTAQSALPPHQLNTTGLFSSVGQEDCDTWSLLGRVVFDINAETFKIMNTFPSKTVSVVTTCSEAISAIRSLPNGMRCANCIPH